MLQETKEFRILLVGGEENKGEMDSLKKAVEDRQLSNWIILTDEVNVEDVPIFLGISDVFVLPSYREGMPMSIIEAMRSGKPVVATTVGGIPDMIETGVSGILVDPGAPNEIASAILKLKNNESLLRNMGIGARKAFEAGFGTSRVVREIRRIYEEMITE
jgi:glycosyltransferase involved in cell wall biosynthesis